ncbi:MAG TPA: glutathione S-transferase N-terminal domain-containing protein [Kiloniellales bacterium]
MIDLYTWGTPNGRKVSIMLEEVGLAYRVHAVDIGAGEQFEPSFLEVSPGGKIPAIFDQEAGIRMMQSGAILLYLAEKTGRFVPMDKSARWQVMEWLMWQMGDLGPLLGQAHHFLKFNEGKAPYAETRYHTIAKQLYDVLERRLDGRDFIVDDYSVVDIATWPWISRFEWHRVKITDFPNVTRWYRAIAARPAVQAGYHQPKKLNEIPMP